MTFRKINTALMALAVLAWAAGSVSAQTVIVDSSGFEVAGGYSTTFAGSGKLEGQPAGNPPLWLRTAGPDTSTAVVQNTVFLSGTQAVQVDKKGGESPRWSIPSGFGQPSQPIVVVDFDMRVTHTPGGASFGPFFGSESYDTDGISNGVGLFGSLGVDATTGDVLYQAQDTGFLTETGSTVPFDVWNHYRMVLDFTFDQYSFYLNSTLLGTTGFVDRAAGLDDLTDSDISAIPAAGDATSLGLPGQAFFDNFLVRQYPNLAAVPDALVPEPGTIVLAAVGMGALLVARRRRRSK